MQAPASPLKVCNENETKKKQRTRKNIINGRRTFIGQVWKTHAMNINEL